MITLTVEQASVLKGAAQAYQVLRRVRHAHEEGQRCPVDAAIDEIRQSASSPEPCGRGRAEGGVAVSYNRGWLNEILTAEFVLTDTERLENECRAVYQKPPIRDGEFLLRRLHLKHRQMQDERDDGPFSLSPFEFYLLQNELLITLPFSLTKPPFTSDITELFGRAVVIAEPAPTTDQAD